MPRKNIQGLDFIRFSAALLVAIFHLGYWVWAFPTGQSGRIGIDVPDMPAFTLIGQFGWVGVEVFFVISGFVIAFSSQSGTAVTFAYNRVLRLLPAVLIIAPVSAAVGVAVGAYTSYDVAYRLLRTVIFIPFAPWVDTVYWTLGIEISFYACVGLFVMLRLADRIEVLGLALGTVSTVFWIWYAVDPHKGLATNRLLDLALVHHGALFGLGVVLWATWQRGLTRTRAAATLIFSVIGVLQIAVRSGVEAAKTGENSVVLLPIMIWILALAAIVAALRLPINLPGMRTIGLMTYPLYLLHNVTGAALLGALCRSGVAPYVAMAVTLSVAVGMSWVTAVHLEPRVRKAIRDIVSKSALQLQAV